ncbi:MAG: PAS domain S-box protein [Methanoregula sp.]
MLRILYVDDETTLLDASRRYLERQGGFFVDTAGSASAALPLLAGGQYDAIVSDYQMPDMDGIGFLKTVRASKNTIPFILFTGRGREEVVIQALNEGADFYLQKGGDPKAQFAELIHKIHQAVEKRRAERALLESEERYRNVVEDQTEFISRFTPDGTHIFVNNAYCRYFGLARDEILGHRFRPEIHREDKKRVSGFFSSLTRDHPAGNIEHRIIMPDGTVRWQRWSDRAIFDSSGTLTEYQSVGRDITERIRDEEALHASEQRLNSIYNTVEDVIFQLDVEGDGQYRFTSANSAFARVTGVPLESVIRKKVSEVIPEPSLTLVLLKYRQAIETKTIVRWEETTDYPTGRLTGEVSIAPIFDTAGTCTHLIGSVHDITGRKIIENQRRVAYEQLQVSEQELRNRNEALTRSGEVLRESERRLLMAQEIGKIGHWEYDPGTGKIQGSAEALRIYGFPPVAGSYPIEEIEACVENREQVQQAFADFLAGKKLYDTEITVHPKNGLPDRVVHSVARFETDEGGKPLRVMGVIQDITDRKRSQEALLAIEHRFHLQYQDNPLAIFTWQYRNGDFVLIECNKAAVALSAGRARGYLGKTASALYASRPELIQEVIQKCLYERSVVSKDLVSEHFLPGRLIHTTATFIPPDMVMVHMEDITEQKQARAALEESELLLREVFDKANDAIFLVETAPDKGPGKYSMVNKKAVDLLGYSKEELLRMSPRDIVPEHIAQKVVPVIKKILARDGEATFESAYRRKDGNIFPIEVSVHMFTYKGREISLSIIRDITERKRAQRSLQESEQRYRLLTECVKDVVWQMDAEMRFTYISPSVFQQCGYTPEEIVGKRLWDFITPECAKKVSAQMAQRREPGPGCIYQGSATYLLEQLCRDGSVLSTEVVTNPVSDAKEHLIGWRGISRDISKRKRSEDELRLANKKLKLLSGITRHDIRNQLMALGAYIHLAEMSFENPAEMKEFIAKQQKIIDVISRQISFTKDYEHLGMRSSGWQDVEKLALRVRAALPMQDIRLETRCPGLEVYADPLLEKVFYNLIDNSLRYGGAKMTAIHIAAKPAGESLRIIVEDDGDGISTEDKAQLFTKGFGKNTGLGLFFSREILSITGITIAENGEPGRGARFVITVPKGAWRFVEIPEQKR